MSVSLLLLLFFQKKECVAPGEQEVTLISGYIQKMEGKKWSRLWVQLQDDCTLYLYKTQEVFTPYSSYSTYTYSLPPPVATVGIKCENIVQRTCCYFLTQLLFWQSLTFLFLHFTNNSGHQYVQQTCCTFLAQLTFSDSFTFLSLHFTPGCLCHCLAASCWVQS